MKQYSIYNTGIDVLDEMIGIKERGFDSPDDHSIVFMIRGKPGSGKTTLALQIVDSILNGKKGGNQQVYFYSMESDAMQTLSKMNQEYNFFSEEQIKDQNQLIKINGDTLKQVIYRSKNYTGRYARAKKALQAAVSLLSFGSLIQPIIELFDFKPSAPLSKILKIDGVEIEGKDNIVVIDSINSLVMLLATIFEVKPRLLLNNICDNLRSKFKNALIIITSEFHDESSDFMENLSESYFCDIEIVLNKEVVKGSSNESSTLNPLGYHIQPNKEENDKFEYRSFCRVVKSRASSNQSRRCAYDIMSGEGLKFFETYPADGALLLYQENEPQIREWNDLKGYSLPKFYPAIRFETFNRNHLQRVSYGLRQLRNIPPRTDLYLSSFDSNWIQWYDDLWERGEVRKFLEKSNNTNSSDEEFLKHVAATHAAIRKHETVFGGNGTLSSTQKECFEKIQKARKKGTFFAPINSSKLKLFGENNSPILEKLKEIYPPVDKSNVLTVPYDANVSLYVLEKEEVKKALGYPLDLRKHIKKVIEYEFMAICAYFKVELEPIEDSEENLNENINTLHNALRENGEFNKFMGKYPDAKASKMNWDDIVDERIKKIRNSLDFGVLELTWEEVAGMASVLREKAQIRSKDSIKRSKKTQGQSSDFQVLIETQSPATFICTFLEIVWGCGGEIIVNPDYNFQDKELNAPRIFLALSILSYMFKNEFIPRNSTLALSANKTKTSSPLFSRHWYSTLVDVITAEFSNTNITSYQTRWKWDPKKDFSGGLMKAPGSLFAKYIFGDKEFHHHSCLGEWHLAILNGSENMTLGIELINHLMSSSKIRERAFAGAALPTVEEFYKTDGNTKCFGILTDRSEIVVRGISSFDDLRKKFIETAKHRKVIFDYRHTMMYFHGLLAQLNSSGQSQLKPRELLGALETAIKGIKNLASKNLLAS